MTITRSAQASKTLSLSGDKFKLLIQDLGLRANEPKHFELLYDGTWLYMIDPTVKDLDDCVYVLEDYGGDDVDYDAEDVEDGALRF